MAILGHSDQDLSRFILRVLPFVPFKFKGSLPLPGGIRLTKLNLINALYGLLQDVDFGLQSGDSDSASLKKNLLLP